MLRLALASKLLDRNRNRSPSRAMARKYLPLALLCLSLAGCGVPDQLTMAPDLEMPDKQATTTSRLVKRVERLPGELDRGSVAHALTVNGVQLLLTYYTTEEAKLWKPDSQGTVNVTAQVQGIDRRLIARITRFKLLAPPVLPKGNDVTLVSDEGQFVIGRPYSYGTAFALPTYPPKTPRVKLRAYVDLEIETKPKSGQYTRQSVIDTLRVSLTPAPENVPMPHSAREVVQ